MKYYRPIYCKGLANHLQTGKSSTYSHAVQTPHTNDVQRLFSYSDGAAAHKKSRRLQVLFTYPFVINPMIQTPLIEGPNVRILDNILSYQQVTYDDMKSTICSPVRGYIVPHIKLTCLHPNADFGSLNMQQEKKVKTLISLILITLVTTSFSIAQSNEETDSVLVAKAEIENSADRNIFTDGESPSDISLLVKNELKLEKHPDQIYESPSLKAEDLPLVMSSADKRTMSVVIPPFLYFKKQF